MYGSGSSGIENVMERIRSFFTLNDPFSVAAIFTSLISLKGIDISHRYDNKKKGGSITITNMEKIPSLSSYRSSSNNIPETDGPIIEEQKGTENGDRNEENPDLKPDNNDNKINNISKINNPIFQDNVETTNPQENSEHHGLSIYDIAYRMYDHSDIWVCKTCPRSGDKWEILNHHSSCKRNKK